MAVDETTITLQLVEEPLAGKRAAVIANLIQQLVEAKGEPIPWSEMCEEAGIEGSTPRATFMLAMHSLELVGAVDRWEYVEHGEIKPRPAFALAAKVKVGK